MGNNLTALQSKYFKILGVPARSQNKFKKELEHFCKGCELPEGVLAVTTTETRKLIANEYLNYEYYKKYWKQRETPQNPKFEPTEEELLDALYHLVNIVIKDVEKQESQNDPLYAMSEPGSSSTPTQAKKRKRGSDETAQNGRSPDQPYSGTTFTKPKQPHASATTSLLGRDHSDRPPRSETVGREPDSPEIIASDDDNESDTESSLPTHSQLLSTRPSRVNDEMTISMADSHTTSSERKGKAPVRDPPMTLSRPLLAGTEQSIAAEQEYFQDSSQIHETSTAISEGLAGGSGEERGAVADYTPDSPTPAARQRKSRNMQHIEATNQSRNASPTVSAFNGFPSPAHSQRPASSVTGQPLSPPPTVHRPSAIKHLDAGLARNLMNEFNGASAPPPPAEERLLQLLDEIVGYIGECEARSNTLAEDTSSSAREKQNHNIRAVAFGNMKEDIEARIKACLGNSRGTEWRHPTRSYCLHL